MVSPQGLMWQMFWRFALETNQETAAKFAQGKNRRWKQLGRGGQDARQIWPQPGKPNQSLVVRTIDDPLLVVLRTIERCTKNDQKKGAPLLRKEGTPE